MRFFGLSPYYLQSVSINLIGRREADDEGRPLPFRRNERDRPAKLLHERFRNIEAKPGALPFAAYHVARTEEFFKDHRLVALRDAAANVRHDNHLALTLARDRD